MFRALLFVAAIALLVIAALGAFGAITGINFDGYLAAGLACLALGVLDLEEFVTSRRGSQS